MSRFFRRFSPRLRFPVALSSGIAVGVGGVTQTSSQKKKKFISPVHQEAPDAFDLGERSKMRAANIQGYLYPPFVGSETVNWLQNNWDTSENDVIVVGFPRSGTTWVLNIILEIIQHADPLQINFLGINDIPWIEVLASKSKKRFEDYASKNRNSKRIWRTHAFWSMFPAKSLHPDTKFIYITRDPKDVVVSQFHFYKKEPNIKFEGNFDRYFDLFTRGLSVNGSYFDFNLDWHRARNDKTYVNHCSVNNKGKPQILWLYYEDIQENPQGEISKIINFLGYDNKFKSESQLNTVVSNSSFHQMKQYTDKEDSKVGEGFFRKGVVGDWVNHFSRDQKSTIDEMVSARFHNTGIKYAKDSHYFDSMLKK